VKKLSGLFVRVTYFTADFQQLSTLYVRHMAHGTWHMTKLFYKKM